MAILRHSDPSLTLARYSHLLRGQEAEAIANLPDLSLPAQETQRATGTLSKGEDTLPKTEGREKNLARFLAAKGAVLCSPMQSGEAGTPIDAAENADSTTPERIRTPNLRFRRPTLCPIELQALHC